MFCGRTMRSPVNKRGFTLVELLVTISIVMLIIPSFMYFFKTSLDRAVHYLDYRCAVTRISMAESLLRLPVYYCGYGMPLSADIFHESFGNIRSEPYYWDGPISVITYNGKQNALLRVVYGMPANSVTASAFKYDTLYKTIHMSKEFTPLYLTADFFGYTRSIRSWVLFGGMTPETMPLQIRNINGQNLLVKSYLNDKFMIPKGDELYLLSAMKIFVKNDVLYTYDFKTTGEQPRVQGIMDMRFIVDKKLGKITAYVLARGNAKRNYAGQKAINGAEACPPEIVNEWQRLNSLYELYASKIVWRLPNCVRGNFFSGKNAAVQF
jgi:prepilin-type N-terminal cleavage/methylation domain-containing protein